MSLRSREVRAGTGTRAGTRRGARFAAFALGAILTLTGCAEPPADAQWTPPQWPHDTGLQLDPATAGLVTADPALTELPFVTRRIRNDRIGLQASYVELPGVRAFNTQIRDMIDDAITASRGTFTPQVFPASAGLAAGGCLPGALSRSATELLSDPRTGPWNGSGTAIVCETLAAFGNVVVIGLRSVTGTATTVSRDVSVTLFTDLSTGEVVASDALWNDDAAAQLWARTIAVLRAQAGALSLAPVAAPDDTQLELASSALATLRPTADGGGSFTVPAGLSSPELTQLGVAATTEPRTVTVDAATLAQWLNDPGAALFAQHDTPFAGLPPWRADLPVDCRLLACIAVTFDDGPSPHTAQLLDTLIAHQAPATMFMLGNAALAHPDMVKRAAAAGFEIGSHTMTHPDLTKLSREHIQEEVLDAEAVLSRLSGTQVTMYRPPYGAVNAKVLDAVQQPAVLWSIDTRDWQDPGSDVLLARGVDAAQRGDIILFHDTHAETVDTAAAVMQGLRDRGFTPVSVSQLFGGNVPIGRVS